MNSFNPELFSVMFIKQKKTRVLSLNCFPPPVRCCYICNTFVKCVNKLWRCREKSIINFFMFYNLGNPIDIFSCNPRQKHSLSKHYLSSSSRGMIFSSRSVGMRAYILIFPGTKREENFRHLIIL